jgi:P27 family predicted phage terminase small subunit
MTPNAVPPPDHLPEDGKDWWWKVQPILADVGLLEHIDTYVLCVAAEIWGEIQAANRVIADHRDGGFFSLGSTGQLVVHPALKIRADAQARFLRVITELGLTPLSRARLGQTVFSAGVMQAEMESLLAEPEFTEEELEAARKRVIAKSEKKKKERECSTTS